MFRLVAAGVLTVVLCCIAYGDTIVLTNGGKLYGKIVKEKTNEKEVTIQLPNKGTITVNRDQIERIEINEIKGPRLGPPSKSPLVPAQPKEKEPKEQPEKDKPLPGKPDQEEKKEQPLDPELKERIDTFIYQLGLARKQHRGRRNNAMAELAKIGGPAVPFLITALESGRSSKAKWGAARVLGDIGDKRATEPLIKHLRDSDQFIRKESVEALWKITNKKFGFDPLAQPQSRNAAARKWEEWWQKEEEEKRKAEELKKKEQDAGTPAGQAKKEPQKAPAGAGTKKTTPGPTE